MELVPHTALKIAAGRSFRQKAGNTVLIYFSLVTKFFILRYHLTLENCVRLNQAQQRDRLTTVEYRSLDSKTALTTCCSTYLIGPEKSCCEVQC